MTKKKKPKVDWRIVSTGLICLTGYGVYAASQGINGAVMAAIIGVIAFAIGVKVPDFMKSN